MNLKTLKGLLGIPEDDVSQDISLQFVIGDVEEAIQNYCNRKEVPPGLEHTAYRMAIDLYRYDRPGEGSAPVTVSSLSEGDTSTSFTSASQALDGGVLKDYKGQLNRYRRVVW